MSSLVDYGNTWDILCAVVMGTTMSFQGDWLCKPILCAVVMGTAVSFQGDWLCKPILCAVVMGAAVSFQGDCKTHTLCCCHGYCCVFSGWLCKTHTLCCCHGYCCVFSGWLTVQTHTLCCCHGYKYKLNFEDSDTFSACWVIKHNPACTKSVRVFKMLKLDTVVNIIIAGRRKALFFWWFISYSLPQSVVIWVPGL